MAAIPSLGQQFEESQADDTHPLLMEQTANPNEHVIDMTSGNCAPASVSHGDTASTSTHEPVSLPSLPSLPASDSRNASSGRRGDTYGRRHTSPSNSVLWISIDLVVNVSQIIAAIIILSLSRHEHPQAPLFAWVICYTAGCIATLPHLYWRYIHRNSQGSEQESAHPHQGSSQNPRESTSYTTTSFTPASEGDHSSTAAVASRSRLSSLIARPRLNLAAQNNVYEWLYPWHLKRSHFTGLFRAACPCMIIWLNMLVDHFKMALNCFFAVWFVVGNVWAFGGHSAADSPNLYRLCIVFLTFSCIWYAMPSILCAMICCCMPCIISIMGFREDSGQNKGATTESINALPTYKFQLKRSGNREDSEINSESQGEGGILAAGTDKERTISAEDAVCCICLAKYGDGEELRELPCSHFFHMECVDKWLKIDALCPLCRSEVGNTVDPPSGTNTGRRQRERRVGNGAESLQEMQ